MRYSFLILFLSFQFLSLSSIALSANASETGGLKTFSNFENELWGNIKGSDLIDLIERIPDNIDSVQRQFVGKLISAPFPEKGYNKKTPILEKRLNTLIRLGLFDDAIALYQATKDDKTSKDIHKLGLSASLFAQKIDLTCVEYFVLIRQKSYPEWPELEKLCDKNLSSHTSLVEDSNSLLPPALPEFKRVEFDKYINATIDNKALMIANEKIQTTIPKDFFKDEFYKDSLELLFALKHHNKRDIVYKHTMSLLYYYGLIEDSKYKQSFVIPESITSMHKDLVSDEKEISIKKELLESFVYPAHIYPQGLYDSLLDKSDLNKMSKLLSERLLFGITAIKALNGSDINYLSNVHKTMLKDKNAISPAQPLFVKVKPDEHKPTTLIDWHQSYCGKKPIFSKPFCNKFNIILPKIINLNQLKRDNLQNYEKLFSLTNNSDYVMSYVGIVGVSQKNLENIGSAAILYSIVNGMFYENTPVTFGLEPYSFFYDDMLDKKKQMYVIIKTLYAIQRNEV